MESLRSMSISPAMQSPERLERQEAEQDYYRSLPAWQFHDLVQGRMPRIWRLDPLVVQNDLQGMLRAYAHVLAFTARVSDPQSRTSAPISIHLRLYLP